MQVLLHVNMHVYIIGKHRNVTKCSIESVNISMVRHAQGMSHNITFAGVSVLQFKMFQGV